MTIWYTLCSFGTFFLILVSCAKKNLATLARSSIHTMDNVLLCLRFQSQFRADKTRSLTFSKSNSRFENSNFPESVSSQLFFLSSGPGLPDFYRCNTPKRGTIYQMSTKCTKWPYYIPFGHKIDKMGIKIPISSIFKIFQNLPKLGFLVWKYTIWQHCDPGKTSTSFSTFESSWLFGSATACASSSALHFSNYAFWAHHPVYWDDWHLLARAMTSDISVAWQFSPKEQLFFSLWNRLHAWPISD
jgi:hypothetical protein